MDTAFFILQSFVIQAASLFIHSGMDTALHSLPDGASVGVLTMKGSFCPITLGHVDVFRQGRDFLLDPERYGWCHQEKFSHCIGILSMNSSEVVNCKMDGLGENSISFEDRTFLVSMAIEDITWLTLDHGWSTRSWMTWLQCQWPHLSFERFVLNGADDVVKHCKWHWASSSYRMITVGRNLSNDAVVQAMREYDIEEKDLHFIFLPDVSDTSSTTARGACKMEAIGGITTLRRLLHPSVATWIIKYHGSHFKKKAPPPPPPPKGSKMKEASLPPPPHLLPPKGSKRKKAKRKDASPPPPRGSVARFLLANLTVKSKSSTLENPPSKQQLAREYRRVFSPSTPESPSLTTDKGSCSSCSPPKQGEIQMIVISGGVKLVGKA